MLSKKSIRQYIAKPLGVAILATALVCPPATGLAQELSPGAVINAGNLDQLLEGGTFEQHPISELIPSSLQKLIRDYALKITLRNSTPKPFNITQRYWDVTEKYAPQVKFDPASRHVSGYVAGIPFPEISLDDPHAGDKELYNLFWNFGWFSGASRGNFPFLFVSANRGVERTQLWHETVLNFSGRAMEPHTLPFAEKARRPVQKRDALFAIEPFDIKGLGVFTQRYADGSPDDAWVYIRAIRRVRRLSGGSWSDAIGGSDVHLDDINGFNAHPTWFKGARLVEKRWILHWYIDKPQQNHAAKTLNERYPYLDLAEWPHWNSIQQWEPIQVNVIEIIPEDSHPFYSRKVLYTYADYPGSPFLLEGYDKLGDLWKVETIARGSKPDERGEYWFSGFCSFMYDLKREHATLLVGDEFGVDNEIGPEDVTHDMLIVQ
jgi:hypothetical protein